MKKNIIHISNINDPIVVILALLVLISEKEYTFPDNAIVIDDSKFPIDPSKYEIPSITYDYIPRNGRSVIPSNYRMKHQKRR